MDKESVLQKEIVQSTVRFSSFQLVFAFALVKCSELLPANSGSDKGNCFWRNTLFHHVFKSSVCFEFKVLFD